MVTEKEQHEMDRIAYVFEKFLYGKLFAYEGYKAEALRIIVGPPDQEPQDEQPEAG